MTLIKQASNKINGLEKSNATPVGPAPAYLQSRLANYQTALAWLSS